MVKERKVGDEIRDDDGKLICRLAKPAITGTMITREHFTDWQIPVPKSGEEMHPAIAKYCSRFALG